MKKFLLSVLVFSVTTACCPPCFIGGDKNKDQQQQEEEKQYDDSSPPSGELEYSAPESWVKEAPDTAMKADQFNIADGKAKAAVYFLPGMAGGVEANVERWEEQFKDDASKIAAEVKQFNKDNIPVTLAEIGGTYLKAEEPSMPDSPKTEIANQAMIAAIVQLKEGLWFIKMLGEKDVVEQQKASFNRLINSLRVQQQQQDQPVK